MMNFQEGQTLLFNKPKGWSSFDVVKKARGIIQRRVGRTKVGHAGTLDPLATGLLILCTGKHTKQIERMQELGKGYQAVFKLGATTPSYDAEFPEENICDTSHISQVQIEEELGQFRGEITQYPPIFSAVKIDGKRAYKSARKGEEVKLRPRIVKVSHFEITEYQDNSYIKAEIHCSKGTYIRSLVHDLGQKLGVGAYLLDLSRTFIGPHKLEDAWEIEDFQRAMEEDRD